MKTIKIVKLKDCEDPYQANHIPSGCEYIGEFHAPPEVGECFYVGDDFRTSTVKEIINENTFKTCNSIYRFETINQ